MPEGAHSPGTEGVLQGTMEPFDHPVGLRVEGSGLMMDDPKDCTQALPKGRDKLGATIRGQMGWDSKTGDPVHNEGVGTVGGGGGGHGDGLRPPGGEVHDGEEVLGPGGGRQAPDEVHMEVAKPPGGHGDDLDWGLRMPGDLAALVIYILDMRDWIAVRGSHGVQPAVVATRGQLPSGLGTICKGEAQVEVDQRMIHAFSIFKNLALATASF